MDNQDHQTDQYKERRNSNTEYMPTKCRITKPAPPKPATNPLQFIKVAPCPLFQKAQEQIKKVEEIKREEKEMRTEIEEDWQTNLDNWKSSRRKRQEHIIERVVEVKKLTEQEENEKGRRKSKTFSEMMEERSKGRHKFNIPLYEDDSNDLSDYGIGSSSSKTNSIKDADTDDSNSLLDEKDNHIFDSSSNKENSSASNQSQSEDETNTTKNEHSNVNNNNAFNKTYTSTYSPRLNSNKSKPEPPTKPSVFENNYSSESKDTKQYTYEGAIQDYRSRIQTINSDDSSRYKNKEQTEVLLPKGEIFKRKGLFESNSVEISPLDSPSARRLSEDFVNTKSIKDRLRSFEQANDQTTKTVDKSDIQVSVKQRLQTFNKPNENDTKNNNLSKTNINKISNYLIDKSNNTNTFESKKSWNNDDRCFSPETELYVNKLNMFNRDLDNLMINKSLDENYAPSISSTELTCVSSDREDSGIHTGDVSCSVSQADESVDVEIASNINERLNEDTQFEKELAKFQADIEQFKPVDKHEDINENQKIEEIPEGTDQSHVPSTKEVIHVTEEFLEFSRKDASENLTYDKHLDEKEEEIPLPVTKPKPVIYENVDIKKFSPALDFITNDFIMDTPFPDFNPPPLEPPKVKPPPPPPPKEDEEVRNVQDPVKRANSTKRIKKEINSKRSSFLGLEEPTNEIDVPLEQPPDLSRFFPPKESKLEKIVGRKYPEGVLSKVESQDSGLDLDRGRLSSDTWCSSVNDSIAPSHERQASGQTNSITSEEDEITKKEREIIELVEKEEQYRDIVEYINKEPTTKTFNSEKDSAYEPSLGSEQFDSPCFNTPADFLDQDSEVLKVEQELRQLELEELERQRENLLFRESRAKAHLHSRHSLENLADKMYPCYLYENHVDCRKSMPELAIQNASFDYGRLVPNKHNYGYENIRDLELRGYVKPGPLIEGDLGIPINNRKSMPDLQHSHKKSSPEHHRSPIEPNVRIPLEQRKSMPELQQESSSAFKTPRPSIIPAKPLRAKEWGAYEQNAQLVPRQLTAVHRRDKWPHPKANGDGRNYNQHWLIQEAELRRISDQQKDLAAANNANRQQQRQRIPTRINNEKLQHPIQRPEQTYKEDYIQHSFRNHPPSVNHALPTVAYSPPVVPKESHDRILSVSGKKKCSYCGNELGRGAAMIVESLCLFYHMDCFKCCVCHVQLGDGRMGTDVKVRNQKLHCHNCYSSDDGVKFSCV